MTMCCPLSEPDGYATVYNVEYRAARKERKCDECGEPIAPKMRYQHVSMLFDGEWTRYSLCLMCVEIGDHFNCYGRILGQLWEELEEYFFPDMKCGGQCMEGLSPEAKRYLIDRRMEWYFEQDECDDQQWDHWTPDKPPRPAREAMEEGRTLQRGDLGYDQQSDRWEYGLYDPVS